MADSTLQALPAATALAAGDLFYVVQDPAGTPVDRKATVQVARAAMAGSVAVAPTDGDTYRRVTVSDATVSATSRIVGSVQRPSTADDSADLGWVYTSTIARVAAGVFDVIVVALAWGTDDSVVNPNETVTFNYVVG